MAPQQASRSTASTDEWDTYSADVALTMSGGDLVAAPGRNSRQVAYHRERTLTSDSSWLSTLTFTVPPGSPQVGDRRIGRITFDEGTGAVHQYDITGREQPLPSQSDAPASLKLPPSFDPWPAHGSGARVRKNKNSRDWADKILLTAAARERGRVAIVRAFGGPSTNANRQEVYHLVRGEQTLELIRDPGTGLVLEHNVLRAGQRTAHVTYSYAQVSDGVFVPAGTHSELTSTDERVRPLVVDETITNVRFTKRGGQP